MDKKNNLQFVLATKDDVDELTAVMTRAFNEDSMRHLGRPGGPPGYDNGDFIRKWYWVDDVVSYKVLLEGKIVAAFSLFIHENHENILGNIYIDPDYEDQGYGSYIWKYIESMYPETVKWSTETPGFSKRNHNFYVNKCGFHVIKIENPKDLLEESYILEKVMK